MDATFRDKKILKDFAWGLPVPAVPKIDTAPASIAITRKRKIRLG